jgi:hypothetical protein
MMIYEELMIFRGNDVIYFTLIGQQCLNLNIFSFSNKNLPELINTAYRF